MDTSQQIFEFRGVDKFYFAEVLQDDAAGYSCGTPVHIPVQDIAVASIGSAITFLPVYFSASSFRYLFLAPPPTI